MRNEISVASELSSETDALGSELQREIQDRLMPESTSLEDENEVRLSYLIDCLESIPV